MTVILRTYQTRLAASVANLWDTGHRNVVMVLPTGGGKCLGKGTPVMMYDGSIVAVENVKPGDLLMGPDSKPKTVLSTCRGVENLYCVQPVKGDAYVVNESHILSLKTTGTDNVVNLSVREYLQKAKNWKHLHKGWKPDRVDFAPSAPLPIDPYILGVWLGDGHSGECCITSMDDEIILAWARYAVSLGMNVVGRPAGGRSVTVGISKTKGLANPVTDALRGLDVWKNKHVPHLYKTASYDDRRQLLAGMMDTDGSYTGKGYDFISKIRELSDGVAFVARSLGLSAYVAKCTKSSQNGTVGTYYRVSICGDVNMIPCRLPHKQAHPRRQIKSVLKTGITVSPLGPGEYFGFELDGDGLFLLGDFTVTHNTRILAAIVEGHAGASCVIAHRSEIVSQLSMALAECGVRHNLIASKRDKEAIAALHVKAFGRAFFDPNAPCAVASVDTLIRRKDLAAWAARVTLWVTDEGHHLVLDNKWDKATAMFTHSHVRGLLPTATPARADGRGLGRREHGGDGVADAMVQGPELRWLIDEGYLCDYRVIGANSHVEELLGAVGATGDWSTAQLRAASETSTIVGDAASTYARLNAGQIRGAPAAPGGRSAILFAPDVKTAADFLQALRAAGVRAELVTGETDPGVRRHTFARLEDRQVQVVVAVDIVSEGTDIPALELGIFCRATASLAVYMQQFGRVLRPLMTPEFKAARTREERLAAIAASPKPVAYIIDHVGNFTRHGPPDRVRDWSLASVSRRAGPSDAPQVRYCCEPTCGAAFERFRPACPYCGWEPPAPPERKAPAMVEGDLTMLDPEVLAALRGRADEVPRKLAEARERLEALRAEAAAGLPSLDDYRAHQAAAGLPQVFIWRNAKAHAARLETFDETMAAKIEKQMAAVQAAEAQDGVRAALLDAMAAWGGYARARGLTDREIQRLFYERFGVDVITPLSYGPADAAALIEKILFDGSVKMI